ncbi:hypothetical protein [Deinococcus sp. YIM 77859]|uniref:hypothetical protein n=1 Tax=Deinococcus sp. YIM 77859 TaxID=1540221 RepID=UPI0005544B67|nr:hypothetical protein [Deinococcus sp. YIM 77859]
MLRLILLLLPLLLGSCALLGSLRPPGVPAVEPPAGRLSPQASAAAPGRAITVTLTLRNDSGQPLTLRYAAQVNWGRCGLPPYVALAHVPGETVAAPTVAGPLTCPELSFTRTLAAGDVLTLRRTLPPLPPGTYRLTTWFDGEANGQPIRVQADPLTVTVR